MSGVTCKQAYNLFDAHLNGELGGAMSTELGAHLLKCASCRHELALLEVAGHVIRSETDEPRLSGDFAERLMACIEQPPPIPFYRRARVLVSAGSVLAAACLFLAVTMWPGHEELVKGIQENFDGELREAGSESVRDRPPTGIDDATDALRRRLQMGASKTQDAVNSLEEAGRRTLLETIHAMQLRAQNAEGTMQPPPDKLRDSPKEDEPETGLDEEVEDL